MSKENTIFETFLGYVTWLIFILLQSKIILNLLFLNLFIRFTVNRHFASKQGKGRVVDQLLLEAHIFRKLLSFAAVAAAASDLNLSLSGCQRLRK